MILFVKTIDDHAFTYEKSRFTQKTTGIAQRTDFQ